MKKYYFLLISALFLFSCKSSLPEVIEQQENQVQTKQTEKETDKKFTKLCREVAGYSLEKQQGILSMVSIPDSKLTNGSSFKNVACYADSSSTEKSAHFVTG